MCGLVAHCPVESISDVYTVSELKLRAQENPEGFCGITYSFMSKLDLDSSVSRVIRSRWWVSQGNSNTARQNKYMSVTFHPDLK